MSTIASLRSFWPLLPHPSIDCNETRTWSSLSFSPRNLPVKFGTNPSTIFLVIVVTDRQTHTHRQTHKPTPVKTQSLAFAGEKLCLVYLQSLPPALLSVSLLVCEQNNSYSRFWVDSYEMWRTGRLLTGEQLIKFWKWSEHVLDTLSYLFEKWKWNWENVFRRSAENYRR